jgi:hypothetical protein
MEGEGPVSRVDLHTHTNVSDGALAPEVLVERAAAVGLHHLAITDHDAVDALPAAVQRARLKGLDLIPGIELSTDIPHGEVHLLGYYVDYQDADLLDMLEAMRDSRLNRARRMVEKLAELGMPVEWERVKELAGEGSVGRPHVAQAMLEKGYVATMAEAFERWIGREGPAYVERYKLTPAEAIALVRRVGGVPVLAHPLEIPDLENMVAELTAHGLLGLECYYGRYTESQVAYLVALADKYGLIHTGGTDFHGLPNMDDVPLGGTYVPILCVEELKAAYARLRE